MRQRGRRKPLGKIISDTVSRLLEVREEFGGRFTDTDENWGAAGEKGPMASMQGLRAVLGAVGALSEDGSVNIWALVDPHWNSLMEEWDEVLTAVERGGNLARPYDYGGNLERILREGLSKGDALPPYVDSVSWALSTATLVNYTFRLQERNRDRSVDVRLRERTHDAVVKSLDVLVRLQCEDGGWSWSNGNGRNGNLFFTWSAIEGIADYYDYVAGESERDLGIPADDALQSRIEVVSPGLAESADAARKRAADFLSSRYLEKTIRQGIEWADVVDGDRICPPDEGNRLPLVYFDLYVLEGLILCGYDEPGGRVSTTNREQLHRLYRALPSRYGRIREQLQSPEFRETDEVAERSTMQLLLVAETEKRGGQPVVHPIRDPGLWPQFLRTMVLYRFYTSPSHDADPIILSDEDSALEQLLGDRGESSGGRQREDLWDAVAFNLPLTARAIEGLIDAYDYENLLARRPAASPVSAAASDLAAVLSEALLPHLQARLQPAAVAAPPQNPAAAGVAGAVLDEYLQKRDFAHRLTSTFGEALGVFPDDFGIPKKGVLEGPDLLTKSASADLLGHNEIVYKLMERLIWLICFVTSRMFNTIVAEAVAHQFDNDKDTLAKFRELTEAQKRESRTLADRLALALVRMGEAELRADGSGKGEPHYGDLVAAWLHGAGGRGKKG